MPPKKVKVPKQLVNRSANPANESMYLCVMCLVEDNVEKIRCDSCVLWYHFACAKVNRDAINQEVWICDKCQKDIQEGILPITEGTSSNMNVGDPSNNTRLPPQQDQVLENATNNQVLEMASHKPRKSKSVSSNISRRAALALQKLEEERKLLEDREEQARERQRAMDTEYLNLKYSILEDDVASNLSFDDQEIDQHRIESIHQWAASIPHHVLNKNSLVTEALPNDNESQFGKPQLNSTTVNRQTVSENVTSANQTIVTSGMTSVCQAMLPSWLTNPQPVLSNTYPWLTAANTTQNSQFSYLDSHQPMATSMVNPGEAQQYPLLPTVLGSNTGQPLLNTQADKNTQQLSISQSEMRPLQPGINALVVDKELIRSNNQQVQTINVQSRTDQPMGFHHQPNQSNSSKLQSSVMSQSQTAGYYNNVSMCSTIQSVNTTYHSTAGPVNTSK